MNRTRTRLFALLATFALLAIVYGLVVVDVVHSSAAVERTITTAGAGTPIPVRVELGDVDASRGRARLTFTVIAHDRDVLLRIRDDDSERTVRISADEPPSPFDVNVPIDGSERDYPLDHYTASLELAAFAGAGRGALPLRLTAYEGLDDWEVNARRIASAEPGLAMNVEIWRATPIRFFALVNYVAMALLGIAAATLATLSYLGLRRIEPAFAGAIGAMVFALPSLRGVQPGTPQLGVRLDLFVFLWAEVAVVAALSLFVWSWARRGAVP